MNIGIDARLLHGRTGIGRYTRSLFFEFARRQETTDTYYLFYDRVFPGVPIQHRTQQASLPSNFHVVTAECTTRILWTNFYIPRLLRQHNIDVYHGVCNFELPLRKVCRYIVTIHDLVPLFFPNLVPWKHLLFFKLFMKRAAKTADRIVTDSAHSKRDIIRYLGVPEDKIRVIPLGYTPPSRHNEENPNRQRAVLTKYGIIRPYLLFVGVIEPKKNLERLIEAFALLRQTPGFSDDLYLVIVGGKGWLCDHLSQKVQDLQLEESVVFTGFVAEEELPSLYSGAEVFVFPSIYEGFGLPVVEAMSYGVPVVTSTASSLPEIAGDAGILVDPHNPAAIRDGIAEVLSNPQKKARMKQDGPIQARKFSWQRTAKATYNVYQEVVRRNA